jgi:hypothetical protein
LTLPGRQMVRCHRILALRDVGARVVDIAPLQVALRSRG